MNDHESQLLKRARAWTLVIIIGLVLNGATAIPLETEMNWLVHWTGADQLTPAPGWAAWFVTVRDGLRDTNAHHPFMGYGFDWLAYGHFVIAIAFIGAWRDPVRNRWLYDFGLIACALILPYAFAFGPSRGIPVGWQLVDCSVGVFGAVPMWLCRQYARELDHHAVPDHAAASAIKS